MDSTLLVGLAGVVLSCIALGWNIYRDVMDVGRLRVRCYLGSAVGPVMKQGTSLVWSVTNIGRRTIIVQNIGGGLRGEQAHLQIPQPKRNALPRTLQSGEYGLFWTDDFAGLGNPDELSALWAMDTLGRLFKASREDVMKVKADLKALSDAGRGVQP